MTDSTPIQPLDITPVPIEQEMRRSYLDYAMSVIVSRALPDVRDGLKPVHRRILYAMHESGYDWNRPYRKSARVVGDVMGKYHPHGDQSVYDAMVRLAQDFAQRYPLVDGQGNFGNIDGDNAAAMRYTEARLTAVAEALLAGLDDDTVDFRDTYDGEDSEPEVLPARFPNLLANGASGIAVGMATSIPPHNAGELCAALLHLIKFPRATAAKLVEFVPGPDFPTGGVLVEPPDSVVETYKTGRGSFRLRANWQVEKQKHGQYQIVIDEIPYQVQKGRLIEKLADLINERKLPMLADVRDESAETVRLVLEPRSRSIDPEMLMEQLFRLSDLEVRISLNMNVLDARGTPGVMDLRGALWAFLEHRHEVLVRGSKHRLATIERRLEILAGYLIVYLNVDEVIRIVREEDEPKAALVAAFDLTDVQADAILDMRLRRLRRLEEEGIRSEHAALEAEGKELRALLKNEKGRWQAIAAEIREIKKQFGEKTPLGARRTLLAEAPTVAEVPPEAMVEREPITVICSEKGWLRAVKGHVEENREAKYKEGDRGRFWISAETTDKLVLFATNGRFYTIPCDRIQRGRGHGEPVRLMLDLGNDEDIVELRLHSPGRRLLVAASDGRGFVVEEDATIAQTRSGKQVLNVRGDIEARVCAEVPEGADSLALIGENRKLLIIPLDDVPTMTRGRGVTLQRYKDGGLNDAQAFNKADGLTWRSGERTRTETDLLAWLGKRGAAGRLPPKGFSRANRFG